MGALHSSQLIWHGTRINNKKYLSNCIGIESVDRLRSLRTKILDEKKRVGRVRAMRITENWLERGNIEIIQLKTEHALSNSDISTTNHAQALSSHHLMRAGVELKNESNAACAAQSNNYSDHWSMRHKRRLNSGHSSYWSFKPCLSTNDTWWLRRVLGIICAASIFGDSFDAFFSLSINKWAISNGMSESIQIYIIDLIRSGLAAQTNHNYRPHKI